MSTVRTLLLLGLISTFATAEVNSLKASPLPGMTAARSSVVTATLSGVPLAEEKRPLALAFGIALVLATFQRALSRRQRA